jgi:hypothetical protein
MGFLVITDEAKKAIAEIVAWATLPGHVYSREGSYSNPPEDKHTVVLGTYKAMFTLTAGSVVKDATPVILRHLSVAIWPRSLRPGKFPGPWVVSELAPLFGFTGTPQINQCDCGCGAINMVQRYETGASCACGQMLTRGGWCLQCGQVSS